MVGIWLIIPVMPTLLETLTGESIGRTAETEAQGEPQAGSSATLYVSPLGDNSDGSSWAKAFSCIGSAP